LILFPSNYYALMHAIFLTPVLVPFANYNS
jgi:hypothetical protein